MAVSIDSRIRSRQLRGMIIASAFLPVAAMAQQTRYQDPQGRYDLEVPTGWQVYPDTGADQLIVRRGAVQAIVSVTRQNNRNAMTGAQFVAVTAREFRRQCPTFRQRQSGALELAGAPGVYALFTCDDPKSPGVAETESTLTANEFLVGITVIAPRALYYEYLPALDGIRNSVHVTGTRRAPISTGGAASPALSDLKKACAVGAFTQEGCARRLGLMLGRASKPGTAAKPPGRVYRDPQGRFSVAIPRHWQAIAEGHDGGLGVQLRSGANWINLLPSGPAANPSEVVLDQEHEIAARSHSGRHAPFGPAGLVQIFDQGLEIAYDDFTATSAQGGAVQGHIAGIGNVDGKGHDFLLLVESFHPQKKDSTDDPFLSVAQSVHLASH